MLRTMSPEQLRLAVHRIAHLSWKARDRNGGYWREVWEKSNKRGTKWRLRLRWTYTKKYRFMDEVFATVHRHRSTKG